MIGGIRISRFFVQATLKLHSDVYLERQRLFVSIANVLPFDPVRIPPIQTSTTYTIPPATFPRISGFDVIAYVVQRVRWALSLCGT